LGRLIRCTKLIEVRWNYFKGDADLAQQFLSTRRGGSELDHCLWYGRLLSKLHARYSCSATTTRTSGCGSVKRESDQRAWVCAKHSVDNPSGPPMSKAMD